MIPNVYTYPISAAFVANQSKITGRELGYAYPGPHLMPIPKTAPAPVLAQRKIRGPACTGGRLVANLG